VSIITQGHRVLKYGLIRWIGWALEGIKGGVAANKAGLDRKQSSMLGIDSKKRYFTGEAFFEARWFIDGRKCEQ